MCAYMRSLVVELFGLEAGQKVRVQYGGSVKPSNVKEIMDKENIDGALVGGASLEAESFGQLVNFRSNMRKRVMLVIMDGLGYGKEYPGNAYHLAKKPNLERLMSIYPNTSIKASGLDVRTSLQDRWEILKSVI